MPAMHGDEQGNACRVLVERLALRHLSIQCMASLDITFERRPTRQDTDPRQSRGCHIP